MVILVPSLSNDDVTTYLSDDDVADPISQRYSSTVVEFPNVITFPVSISFTDMGEH